MTEQHSPIIEFPRDRYSSPSDARSIQRQSRVFLSMPGLRRMGGLPRPWPSCSTMRGRYLIQLRIGATKI